MNRKPRLTKKSAVELCIAFNEYQFTAFVHRNLAKADPMHRKTCENLRDNIQRLIAAEEASGVNLINRYYIEERLEKVIKEIGE